MIHAADILSLESRGRANNRQPLKVLHGCYWRTCRWLSRFVHVQRLRVHRLCEAAFRAANPRKRGIERLYLWVLVFMIHSWLAIEFLDSRALHFPTEWIFSRCWIPEVTARSFGLLVNVKWSFWKSRPAVSYKESITFIFFLVYISLSFEFVIL